MAGGATRKSNRRVKNPEQKTSVSYDPFRDFEGGPVELFLHKTFYFIRTNFKIVLGAVILAVVALIGAISYNIYQQNQEEEALKDFQALADDPRLGEGIETAEPAARILQEYRQKHPIESARRRSLIFEMDLRAQTQEFEQAGDVAAQLADDLEMPELRAYYSYRSAVFYERAEVYEKSANQFGKMAEFSGDDAYMQAVALFGRGRAFHAMGRTDDAKQAFGDLWAIEKQDEIQDIRAAAAAFLLAR
ncbi:MAG: tetratricopeptide repeat protein [Leptospiraceae bacterium]|nr:tetratricopeptide repeat protein [Leptospiraceae bacterium]